MPDAVDTDVCAPGNGWRYHPKHVEQFPDEINCITLHLVRYILEYWNRISPCVLLGHTFDSVVGEFRMLYWEGREKELTSSASRYEFSHHFSNSG
jgi:hypothetical protein